MGLSVAADEDAVMSAQEKARVDFGPDRLAYCGEAFDLGLTMDVLLGLAVPAETSPPDLT